MRITGKVKKVQGRGKILGFPTANFDLTDPVEDGIYVGFTEIDPSSGATMRLASLVFIGANVTFGEDNRHGEVYILDYDENLYGQEIAVDLQKKIRDNMKFNSPEQLIDQMRQDERVAREFFSNYNDGR